MYLVKDQRTYNEAHGSKSAKSDQQNSEQGNSKAKKKDASKELDSSQDLEQKLVQKPQITRSDALNAYYFLKYAYLGALRSRAAMLKAQKQAFQMEDVMANLRNPARRIESNLRYHKPGCMGDFKARMEWEWLVIYKKFFKIFFAIFLGILSIIILLSETTMYFNSQFSVIGNTIRWLLKKNLSPVQIQIVCLVPLIYMAFGVFYGMFKVKIWTIYGIYPNKSTDSSSLLWSAINFSRVSAPLCCNFLSMVGTKQSAFQSVIGNIDKVPIFGSSFTQIFPFLIIILAILNYYDLITRFLNFLGATDFLFTTGFDHEYIEEGKQIMAIKRENIIKSLNNQTIQHGKVSRLMQLIDDKEKL